LFIFGTKNDMLKFLFTIFLIYLGIKFFSRYILPLLLRYLSKTLVNKMQNQQEGFSSSPQSHKEGKVSIDPSTIKAPKRKHTTGEYIDFEEID